MESYFGIKELYDVSLKCTFPMEINGKQYATNESIIKFDRIQLAPLAESKTRVYASGGYGNAQLINWEKTNEVSFVISEGVISKIGLAILSNSQLAEKKVGEIIQVPFTEQLETDDLGKAELKYAPCQDGTFFIYDADNGARIEYYHLENNILELENSPYKNIYVDYTFPYEEKAEVLTVGKRLVDGYLKLDGKLRLKDDFDGHVKTGIIEIPRVKLMSDLSMRLGSEASPYVYRFQVVGLPVGDRGNQYVCKIIMLDNEIDSDL
jgi:hypothetical protein